MLNVRGRYSCQKHQPYPSKAALFRLENKLNKPSALCRREARLHSYSVEVEPQFGRIEDSSGTLDSQGMLMGMTSTKYFVTTTIAPLYSSRKSNGSLLLFLQASRQRTFYCTTYRSVEPISRPHTAVQTTVSDQATAVDHGNSPLPMCYPCFCLGYIPFSNAHRSSVHNLNVRSRTSLPDSVPRTARDWIGTQTETALRHGWASRIFLM